MGLKKCDTCNFRYDYELDKPCIVYREDCPLYQKEGDGMSGDLISRQAVIDILEKEGHKWGNDYRDWVDAIEEIKKLPHVNPQEPKTGHWVPTYGNVKCSVCGSVKDSRDVGKATHYCDFCGAKMIESRESEDEE